jgi:L-iditol 2-dehydrogenase
VTLPAAMRVARLHAWGDVRVEEMPVPRPGPGEVVVRITACGLCGSDALDWYVARKAPLVPGHEPVGVVAAVGDGVTSLVEGQRVFVHHHAPCMKCEECRRRLWSNCATWRATQLDPGGFAEYARVPAPNVAHDVLPLPDLLSDDAATFVEPVACCLRALDKARLSPDDSIFIIGLGSMGLLLAQLASLRGVSRILGTDLRRDRCVAAAGFGVEAVAPDALSGATAGRGADVVIVTPGTAGAVEAGIAAAAPGGRVVCFTPLDPAEPLRLDPGVLYFREIELLQSYSCGPDETRTALRILADGALDPTILVTHRIGLDGVADALQRAHDGTGLRSIVLPQSGGMPRSDGPDEP